LEGAENKLHRKSIRLRDFDYSEEGAYFITACTKARVPYFTTFPQLSSILETELINLIDRFPSLIIDAFVVMPNHLHVVLFINGPAVGAGLVPAQQSIAMTTPTIGQMFGAYKSLCVKKWSDYLKQNNLSGEYSFWQRNYYEHVIRNQRELNLIREYIAYNPVNWTFDNENPDQVYNKELLMKWGWLEKT
jgi:putative transposase